MKRRALAALLMLAGCGRAGSAPDAPAPGDTGARLEAAAVEQGLIADPAAGSLVGAWARDTDRLCIVEGAVPGSRRIGIVTDYGDGQGCSASGTLFRRGGALRIDLGDCRIDARFDGERITFPAELPAACRKACRGRATLAALEVKRQSESASEAAMLRGRGGRRLCD